MKYAEIKRLSFLAATIAGFAVLDFLPSFGEECAWEISRSNSRFATRKGSILTVDVPEGISNAFACATLALDLHDWSQCVLEAEVMCRGEGIAESALPSSGAKMVLCYTDAETGHAVYSTATLPTGTSDWRKLELCVPFGELPPSITPRPQISLGLQRTSGRVRFDLSTFKVRKAPPVFPLTDNDYVVSYPPCHASGRVPLRGVMGRGGCRNTEQDIEDLHKYGANLIRLQMNGFASKKPNAPRRTIAEWNVWLEKNLAHAERVLNWLEARNMRMVLDMHTPPLRGYGKRCDTFYDLNCAERFISAWREIARRFKGRRGIYGYDLMNEPAQVRRALPECDYWNLQRRAAEAIRESDPDATIVFAANDWSNASAFGTLRALEMDNVIYQVHMYQPHWYTHQGANGSKCPHEDMLQPYPNSKRGIDKNWLRNVLEPVRQFQLRHKARILVGEFSACIYAPGAGRYLEDCIDIFREYGWDWTYHSFREAIWWNAEMELGPDRVPVANRDNPRFKALIRGFKGQ